MKFILLLFLSSSLFAEVPEIRISPLGKNFYVHTSFKLLGTEYFPSNGLVVDLGSGVILVDTAWGEEQTLQLLRWISDNLKKPILFAIISHFHEDRSGGIGILKKKNIPVYAGRRTIEILKEKGADIPDRLLKDEMELKVENTVIQTYYPGPGHTRDNIVIWFPEKKILFGGCLVKSSKAKDIGNTKDADLNEWPKTVRRLQTKYPKISFLVPGHEDWGGKEAFTRTLELLEE